MTDDTTRGRGALERDVLRVLWESDEPAGAADVRRRIAGRTPAYTTVATILERLVTKGLVHRADGGYVAAQSPENHASHAMLDVLAQAPDRSAALLRFVGNLDADDAALLARALGGEPPRTPRITRRNRPADPTPHPDDRP